MPLHLLGKKSWNVYNQENISRVKRDEAQAKALEEEDERRMQEVDAERRIKILRGERLPTPPPPPPPSHSPSEPLRRPERSLTDDAGRFRKRRRIAGEDDTDRDIRFAREDAAHAEAARDQLIKTSRGKDKDKDAPLLDSAGHINLFPEKAPSRKTEKNKEAEDEAAKMKQGFEDQYTMRFSNAAGFKQSIGSTPWYSSSSQTAAAPDSMPEKNVWGNEDPMRKEREKARMDVNDPLAAMKRGVRQLKATEAERKRWNEEKRKQLEALKSEQETSSPRHHRRRRSVDSLEGFKLDAPAPREDRRDDRSSHRRHDRRHYRERSRDRHRDSSHRQSRHSSDRSHRHRSDRDREDRHSHRSEKR